MARTSEYDAETIPNKVLEQMSQGVLDIEIYAMLGVSKTTFVEWRKQHPELDRAYQIGLAQCEAWWAGQGRLKFLEGNDTGHKYWNSVMKNKFNYDRPDIHAGVVNNTQINVGSISMIQEKNKVELIEYLRDQCQDPFMLAALPAQFVEVVNDETDNGKHDGRPAEGTSDSGPVSI